jgi:hypothetical protein
MLLNEIKDILDELSILIMVLTDQSTVIESMAGVPEFEKRIIEEHRVTHNILQRFQKMKALAEGVMSSVRNLPSICPVFLHTFPNPYFYDKICVQLR